MAEIMNAKDVIKGSMAKCTFVIPETNERIVFAHAISLEATMEKNKTTVPVLGKTGKHNVPSGWEGTGSMTMHYNSSRMRQMLEVYKNTGEEIYFDIEVENEAPGSTVGNQLVILSQCSLDGGILAKFDADADYLDEDVDFTFDDFRIAKPFNAQA